MLTKQTVAYDLHAISDPVRRGEHDAASHSLHELGELLMFLLAPLPLAQRHIRRIETEIFGPRECAGFDFVVQDAANDACRLQPKGRPLVFPYPSGDGRHRESVSRGVWLWKTLR